MFSHFHLSYTFFFFARTPQKWCPALSVSRLLRCICLGAADGHLAHGAQGPGGVCRVSPLRSYYCLLYNQSGSYGISFRNCKNTLFLIVFSPTNFSSHRGFLTQTIFTVVFAERWFKFFFALFFFIPFQVDTLIRKSFLFSFICLFIQLSLSLWTPGFWFYPVR